jgi:hypothetical protein
MGADGQMDGTEEERDMTKLMATIPSSCERASELFISPLQSNVFSSTCEETKFVDFK